MSDNNSFTHLTLEERRIIQIGIVNGSTKTAIAKTLGKDKSTIGKEIKLHRIQVYKCNLPLECAAYKHCKKGRNCTRSCSGYQPFYCSRRDRSPGACNGCPTLHSCRFNKYKYIPEDAQRNYEYTLVDSRIGVNLSFSEAKELSDLITPLLKQGLSPYHILKAHPELTLCEKTLYNYLSNDIFHEMGGATIMDLRRKVSRKPTKKKKPDFKKRNNFKYLNGRTYKDYQNYIEENPDSFVAQMDTVYNDESNGPFIQTFKFINSGVLIALLHKTKTGQDMLDGVKYLESILTPDIFRKYMPVILTDRGSEFTHANEMEFDDDGCRRTRIFYCDPMRAGQKGSLENNHIELRYILPKDTNLTALGLVDQNSLNIALSHINSAPVEKLGGKSPLEMTEFLYPDLYEKLNTFGVMQIAKDTIILKPYLLK